MIPRDPWAKPRKSREQSGALTCLSIMLLTALIVCCLYAI